MSKEKSKVTYWRLIPKIRNFESIKKWFTKPNGEKRYKSKTEKVYTDYMRTFCGLSLKEPDELARLTSDQALEIQIDLATKMKERLHFREYTITQMITALHSFWRYNDMTLTDDIMKYKGTSWLLKEVEPV